MFQNPLLPVAGLPATSFAGERSLLWASSDTRDNYLRAGGHPVYGETDILYVFNRFGYRCPEFDARTEISIVAVGCSHVMGVGLPQQAIFAERFAGLLRSESRKTVTLWNLGVPGTSNDHITRMLHLAVPYLNPDITLVNFTHADRRDYISADGFYIPYCPGHVPVNAIARDIKEHFDFLTSEYDDDLNLFRNYKSIESLLADRFWLFSTTSYPGNAEDILYRNFARFKDHVDMSKYTGALNRLDVARDWSHCGPRSHAALADSYWAALRLRWGGKRRSLSESHNSFSGVNEGQN